MKYRSSLVLQVAILGLVMSFAQLAHAYTINTTEVGKRIRWSTEMVGLQLDPEFENFLGPGESYAAIAMAFDAWRGLPRVPDMYIQPGVPESSGHHEGRVTNGVYVKKEWPYEAAKLAVTVVTYEMDTGRLLDADILVNGQAKYALLTEPVTPSKASSYDLAAVLTHEAGHVLGLGESQEGPDATMWPYAKPDDVDKRTLAEDDEDGAVESYLSAPPRAAGGCGHSSVGGRMSNRHALAMSLLFLLVVPLRRMSRRQKHVLWISALSLISAFSLGFDLPSLQAEQANDRLQSLEHLVQVGTRDDVAQIDAMESSADQEIARRAHVARGFVLARPSSQHMLASSVEGQSRLTRFQGQSSKLLLGKAKLDSTVEHDGLLFTQYKVATPNGDTTLRVPGGVRNGIGQRVIDAELPPADEQELVIATQPDGTQHWAYHHQGLIFGGDLGDGPALEGAL